jgi:palmitoyltransferase
MSFPIPHGGRACIEPEAASPAATADAAASPSTATYCGKCKMARPENAHHCAECGCVRHMDHHCPFTMNCVGIHNFAHFYVFLFYASLGLFYASALTFPVFSTCWLSLTNRHLPVCVSLGTSSLMFIPALGLFGVVLFLLAIHTLLLLANMSTVDFFLAVRRGAPIMHVLLEGYRKRIALSSQAGTKASVLLFAQRPRIWHYCVPFSEPRAKKSE